MAPYGEENMSSLALDLEQFSVASKLLHRATEKLFESIIDEVRCLRRGQEQLRTQVGESQQHAKTVKSSAHRADLGSTSVYKKRRLGITEFSEYSSHRDNRDQVEGVTQTEIKSSSIKLSKTKEQSTINPDPISLQGPVVVGFRNAAAAVMKVEQIHKEKKASECVHWKSSRPPVSTVNCCLQCQDSFRIQADNNSNPEAEYLRLMQHGCRHHEKIIRPSTPDGYWKLDFTETPTQSP